MSSTDSSFDNTLASLGIPLYGSSSPASGTSATTNSNGITYDANGNQVLGQSDFLKLLTAQMQDQDPFNPTDETTQIAQMAQFSQMSATTDMNTTLKSIAAKLTGTSTADAMSYVGKTVLVPGSTAYPNTDGSLTGAVEVAKDALDVNVTIKDANGATLKTLDLGQRSAGTVDFTWDGTTDSGNPAGSGPFTVSAAARNGGSAINTTTLVWAPVQSVSMPSGGDPVLSVVGIGDISPSAVRSAG